MHLRNKQVGIKSDRLFEQAVGLFIFERDGARQRLCRDNVGGVGHQFERPGNIRLGRGDRIVKRHAIDVRQHQVTVGQQIVRGREHRRCFDSLAEGVDGDLVAFPGSGARIRHSSQE